MRDIIVVGGGASGLMAAICCAKMGKQVTILEHNEKIGRKLLATGNGKCNFTNQFQAKECYRGGTPSFAWNFIEKFGESETVDFFRNLGVYPLIRNGYYYPYSEQASAVVEALRTALEHYKVKIKCMEHVIAVDQTTNGYAVKTETYTYECEKVILACGGRAGSKLGADGSGYELAKGLGHSVTPLFPALVGLKAKESYFGKLSGIRVKGALRLLVDQQLVAEEQGELQLTAYGISGIPVYQVSRFGARGILEKKEVKAVIQLLPEVEVSEFISFLKKQKRENGYKTILSLLGTFLDIKLSQVFLDLSGIDGKLSIEALEDNTFKQLAEMIKNWEITVAGANDFEQAQVTGGGVSIDEVNAETLESKLLKGLYFTGELLDVDGTCGGYNLQWAWTSGYIAGMAASASSGDFHL